MTSSDSLSLDLIYPENNCTYTKCYCEENVWKLCEQVKENYPEELCHCYAVFISNKDRMIPLWQQRSTEREDTLVVWDYHVIFIFSPGNKNALVYDLDSSLAFPCDFNTYFTQGIRSNRQLQEQYHRQFRVIPAPVFLQMFASDRSHMLNEKGEYLHPHPKYPPIRTEDSTNNIDDFISMDSQVGVGTVLSLVDFVAKFR